MSDVFISYSRKDKDFVRILHDALEKSKRQAWVDWEDIAKGTEWWKEIEAGIEGADTFLFVVSPDSVLSGPCQDEINHAIKNNKQILPIVYRRADDCFDKNNPAHQAINSHNWLFFTENDDFERSFQELIYALNLDIAHVKGHTRLLVRALEWDNKGRKDGFLLRGEDLTDAEVWLKAGVNKDPKPTDLQISYIENSRKVEDANNRAFLILKEAKEKADKQIERADQEVTEANTKVEKAEVRKKQIICQGLIFLAVTVIGAGTALSFALNQSNIAKADADIAKTEAIKQTKIANTAKAKAIKQTNEADVAKTEAIKQTKIANTAKTEAIKQTKIANTAQQKANTATEQAKTAKNNFQKTEIKAFATEAKAAWIDNPTTLDSLLIALKAGHLLQTRLSQGMKVPPVTQWQTKIALQQAETTVQERNRLSGHGDAINSVSFSPDGQTLATASWDSRVKLWDAKTGKELLTFFGHTQAVKSVSFSPDSKILATASDDGFVKLWDLKNLKNLKKERELPPLFTVPKKSADSVSFSSNGNILATVVEGTVRCWDLKTRKELKPFVNYQGNVTSVSFSPDGKTLAIIGSQGLMVLDVTTTKELSSEKQYSLNGVSFSPDSQILATATGGDNGTVNLWDVKTGKKIKFISSNQGGFTSVSFSPHGSILAAVSSDNKIKLWDWKTRKEIKTLSGHQDVVNSIGFSPDGKTLATASWDRTVKLWDIGTEKDHKTFFEHKGWGRSLDYSHSPDKKILAIGSKDKTVKLWDAKTGMEPKTFSGRHKGEVNSVSFSPDDKTVATSSNDDVTIKLWDVKTGKEIKILSGHQGQVNSVSFSPDGTILATGSNDKKVKLWNVTTGKEIKTLSGHKRRVNSVKFSPNGKILATGSDDKTVRLWDVKTGQELKNKNFSDDLFEVKGVRFSPDGTILAAASTNARVKLWNIATGKVLQTLSGHRRRVNSISFSPDGKILATGSGDPWVSNENDKTVRLWDVDKGRELGRLEGHESGVASVSFSSDGKTLASADENGTVILWNFDLDKLMQDGCTWMGSYLGSHPKETELQQICQPYLTEKTNPKP